MAPWPRAPVIPQLVDCKKFRDNRWVKYRFKVGAQTRDYLHEHRIRSVITVTTEHCQKHPANQEQGLYRPAYVQQGPFQFRRRSRKHGLSWLCKKEILRMVKSVQLSVMENGHRF
ncbi:hypothetical protein TNCV_630341 [Trichonephila clavipes]|nr:hypothetical protein TNCV_630341 [Trichonephila clavipes]